MHIFPYILGYLLLGLVWAVTDPTGRPGFKDRSKTTALLMTIMAFQLASALFFPWPATSVDGLATGLGRILFWGGFLLAVWAKLQMKHNWGVPAQHAIARQKTLVTAGPFRYTRNPIYVGLIFMALGASLAIRSVLFPFVFLFIIHIRRIVSIEEPLLTKHFGKAYDEYKRRVPRFLLFF